MLQNLSLRYDAEEDRMVLALNMVDAAGHASTQVLHVTRRTCVSWRADMQAMVDMSAQVPAQLDAAARAHVSKAHHDAMSSQATVRTEPIARPKPSDPTLPPQALVTKVACGRRRADGRWVMRFETKDQPPLALLLSSQTLHALVDALSRRVQTAQWALGPIPAEQRSPAQPDTSKQMH